MGLIKQIRNKLKKPVLLLTLSSLIIVPGLLRCHADVGAQAHTINQINKRLEMKKIHINFYSPTYFCGTRNVKV